MIRGAVLAVVKGIEQFGHTATSGGIYSTVRIPFGTSIRVAIQAPPSATAKSIYWMIVRGIEANPVDMGGSLPGLGSCIGDGWG